MTVHSAERPETIRVANSINNHTGILAGKCPSCKEKPWGQHVLGSRALRWDPQAAAGHVACQGQQPAARIAGGKLRSFFLAAVVRGPDRHDHIKFHGGGSTLIYPYRPFLDHGIADIEAKAGDRAPPAPAQPAEALDPSQNARLP